MDAYINNKFIRFLPYISFLFLPLVSMHASAAVKLGEVEITSTNPEVNGDGKQAHTYRVKVTDTASGAALPGLAFDRDKVIWQAVHPDGKYDYGSLVKEGKLVFGNQGLTTDEQGYLTTTLSSSVGLENVQARLALVTEEGKQESKANTAVKFATPTHLAGLFIYDYWRSTEWSATPEPGTTLHRFYRDTENGPYNITDATMAELRLRPEQGLFNPDIETAVHRVVKGKAAEAIPTFENKYYLGFEYKNPVIEPTVLETTVSHKGRGSSITYTYTLKPQRFLINMTDRNNSVANRYLIKREDFNLNDCSKNTAKDTAGNKYSPVMLSYVKRTGNSQSLLDEYPDITQWGVIRSVTAGKHWNQKAGGYPTRAPIIKVINDIKGTEKQDEMILFDISSNTILHDYEEIPPDAILLCLFNS
ncbi:hypothetical protein [Xenorhabdus sp. IM139775]|uniref:hypothetical protein n=1 Tax=Xenorhabdus sp. IM139775 TaxID=3025876 RepID=UPI002358A8EF|nr:hypothetical protein [Xenorhabdus sp. IM139775]MDC9594917.1 hypothetical protein [Xenorhabdus sp. IM139775]